MDNIHPNRIPDPDETTVYQELCMARARIAALEAKITDTKITDDRIKQWQRDVFGLCLHVDGIIKGIILEGYKNKAYLGCRISDTTCLGYFAKLEDAQNAIERVV